jgi:hypothetical protein
MRRGRAAIQAHTRRGGFGSAERWRGGGEAFVPGPPVGRMNSRQRERDVGLRRRSVRSSDHVPRRTVSRRAGHGSREPLKPCSQSVSARQGLPLSQRRVYPLRGGLRMRFYPAFSDSRRWEDSCRGPGRANEFAATGTRCRPSPTAPTAVGPCASPDGVQARRARLARAVEALFAERVSARQGLPLSQRRVYPLREACGCASIQRPRISGAGRIRAGGPSRANEFAATGT